jgi:putative peptide zinc metalloprotease protein
VLEVSSLLYLVASAIDGYATSGDVAVSVSADGGRRITAEQVEYLIEHKLRPLGVIGGSDLEPRPAAGGRPLLGLTLGRTVVPARWVEAASAALAPLFRPLVVVAVLAAAAAFDVWLVTGPGVGAAMHEVLVTPGLLLAMAAITAFGGGFHELGHASASRYGGARPGVIGVGVYLLWPVFYNDVNDSYRLSRAARLRVDLGGVYFNAVFIVVLALAYRVTGSEVVLVAVVLQHVAVLQQFLPFLRLDGYYLVSDIAGVPDLFARVRPVLARLVPGRPANSATSDLKPGARWIVTAWVLIFAPLLVAALVVMVVRLPGFLATAADAAVVQARGLASAVGGGDPVDLVLSALQLAVYAVPLVGLGVTLARALARLGRFAWSRRRQLAVADVDRTA